MIDNLFTSFLETNNYSEADIARSLLFLISNDIGQIASLYASIHNLNKVYFGGYFLRNHPLSMYSISHAIKYWSKVVSVYFLFDVLIFILNISMANFSGSGKTSFFKT